MRPTTHLPHIHHAEETDFGPWLFIVAAAVVFLVILYLGFAGSVTLPEGVFFSANMAP